jgi:hypothetical protein
MSSTSTPTLASWNGAATTIASFISSLFSSNVRSEAAVQSAIQNGALYYSYADATTRGLILNGWLAAWQKANGDDFDPTALTYAPTNDQILIAYLSEFIKSNSLSMSTPHLLYNSMAAPDPKTKKQYPIYSNWGYATLPFLSNGAWNYGLITSNGQPASNSPTPPTVAEFLAALYYGAHFVVISNAKDLQVGTGPPQLWETFATSTLDISGDKVNSHYSGANLTGYYYLNVITTIPPCFLLAFLVGLTNPAEAEIVTGTAVAGGSALTLLSPVAPAGLVGVGVGTAFVQHAQSRRGASNTFIQLEGWQNHFPWFGGWHSADYAAHNDTMWNFSTFGCCAYSEKRSTPIFLAGSNFSTALNGTTKMPLYNGASSLEEWMQPNLLQVSS